MNVQEFVLKLNSLLEIVVDPSTKEILQECFYPTQRQERIDDKGDLLLTFIFNFDVSNFDIGGVHLNDVSEVREDLQYIHVGSYEGDDIVINKKDKNSIYLIDHEVESAEKIASNSSIFLSNLLAIDEANLTDNLDDHEKMSLIERICEYKEAHSFYLTLIMYGL